MQIRVKKPVRRKAGGRGVVGSTSSSSSWCTLTGCIAVIPLLALTVTLGAYFYIYRGGGNLYKFLHGEYGGGLPQKPMTTTTTARDNPGTDTGLSSIPVRGSSFHSTPPSLVATIQQAIDTTKNAPTEDEKRWRDVPGGAVDVVEKRNAPDVTVLPHQESSSEFTYVTLLHGVDSTFAYRGYFYNAIIAKSSLKSLGSTADFVVLLGFTFGMDPNDAEINKDIELLEQYGIKIVYLHRLLEGVASGDKKKVPFSEMALLKTTPFSFLQYKKFQFLDGDVFPVVNMDCWFKLDINTCNTGNASPLNSGWYLAKPNIGHFEDLQGLARRRLANKWNETIGWGTPIPDGVFFRGGKNKVKSWNFNGASLDQGLLFHYFALTHGGLQLLDSQTRRIFSEGYQTETKDLGDVLELCSGRAPMEMFHHFTGKSKPWLQDLSSPKNKAVKLWADHLDKLNLPLNSKNINAQILKPPLGYFAPNK